jgi:hypothetical protein
VRLTPVLFLAAATLGAQTPTQPAMPGGDTVVVHGLYVNRSAAQNKARMRTLIKFARETGINALVIDLKDEFGLNYHSSDSATRRFAGRAGVADARWLIDTLRENGLMPIARMVVFKDSVAARARPEWTILNPEGGVWRDKQGLAWVNPYQPELREYDLRVATELAQLGFAEIQFDYIRFPEPYASLPKQVFPGAGTVQKPEALASFLREARARLTPLGVRCTADVFGLVTSTRGALEVGQEWEPLARAADVLLPMVYPSHYPVGFLGIAHPNGSPYEVVKSAITKAIQRDSVLGIHGEHVRPWLQAFTLGKLKPEYGNEELTAQFRATYDAGARGWVLWNPGSKYDIYRDALIADSAQRPARDANRGPAARSR